MSRMAVYPGTFDPITFGHMDLAARAAKMVDCLLVAVAQQPDKQPLFSVEQRVGLVSRALADIPNVQVVAFDGLLVDFCRAYGARMVVRGMRALSDFEYEFQMALTNRVLAHEELDTVFLMPKRDYIFLSSSVVKQIARFGGEVASFVPPNVEEALRTVYGGGNDDHSC